MLFFSVERVVLSHRNTFRAYHCGPVLQLQLETLNVCVFLDRDSSASMIGS